MDIGACLVFRDHAAQGQDGAALGGARGRLRPQTTGFSSYGASVRFHTRELPSYAAVPAVRRVRNSLHLSDFHGEHGTFVVDLYSGPGLNRPIKMSLHAEDNRVYAAALMTSEEVWALIDCIYATAA